MSEKCCGNRGCFRTMWNSIRGKKDENTRLKVLGLDPRIIENEKAHPNTNLVIVVRGSSKVGLIIPRGWEFFLKMYFNRDYDPSVERVSILLKLNGISVISNIRNPGEDISDDDWPVSLISQDDRSMKIKLISPINAKLGQWSIHAAVERMNSNQPLEIFPLDMPLFIVEDITSPGRGMNGPRSTLVILDIDPCIIENGMAHKTSKYEIMNRGPNQSQLVVRRNESFNLRLNLNRDYNPKDDVITINISLSGDVDKTRSIKLGEPTKDGWRVSLEDMGPKFIRIKIFSPSNAAIGKWNMEFETMKKSALDSTSKYQLNGSIYMIFNPWCPDDAVFMENEDERQEYVMLETAMIWSGTYYDMQCSAWELSQFEKNILDCALELITDVSKIPLEERGNPILVSRGLAAAVNYDSQDEGILYGNWTDSFIGGTPPSEWIGSADILRKYYRTKKPVKFGQCWVYGGVLATVCRTLGLPCRIVTNYKSAHDTQNDLTIDLVLKSDGNLTSERTLKGDDMIWNFHVWNEVWMKRLDLGSLYDGWQAVDATPQELSEGVLTCGPSSVAAIKRGDLHLAFDNRFIFSEVNADIIYWKYNGHGQPETFLRREISGVGLNISTKAVGRWERHDITDTYKNPDNSIEDREIMMRSFRQIERPYTNFLQQTSDIIFKVALEKNCLIGKTFSTILSMDNQSSINMHEINVIMILESVSYTKKTFEMLKKEKMNLVIEPGKIEKMRMNVSWEEYCSKLFGQTAFNLICIATVQHTNFEYVSHEEFQLQKPKINIKMLTEALVGGVLQAEASFINPLPIPLKNGKFFIQGPGLNRRAEFKLTEPVGAGEIAKCEFSMNPKFEGEGMIHVKFHSEQVDDVKGSLPVVVR